MLSVTALLACYATVAAVFVFILAAALPQPFVWHKFEGVQGAVYLVLSFGCTLALVVLGMVVRWLAALVLAVL